MRHYSYSVYKTYDIVQRSRVYQQPSSQQLADEMTMLEKMKTVFEARYSAIEAELQARLDGGTFIPGYCLEKRYGKKKFTVDDLTIRLMTGINPTQSKTCTPAELIRRGANEDVVR